MDEKNIKWKYWSCSNYTWEEVNKTLDELGSEGWELVSVVRSDSHQTWSTVKYSVWMKKRLND